MTKQQLLEAVSAMYDLVHKAGTGADCYRAEAESIARRVLQKNNALQDHQQGRQDDFTGRIHSTRVPCEWELSQE